jgi:nicotinamidase-related amidase
VGDLKLFKRHFGAFVSGSSDLHAILQVRNIDTFIVTATATNVCCESTARYAMMLSSSLSRTETRLSTMPRSATCWPCLRT